MHLSCSRLVLTLVVIALAAGCGGNKKKHRTQKEVAMQQWNATRANVLYSLARDQYETGNLTKSRQTTIEAMRLDPENPNLRVLSAKLSLEQGELDAAEAELVQARQLAPKHAEAHYLSGVIRQRWQRHQEAHDFYKTAAELAPGELAYLMAQGEMLVAMDRPAEALTLLQGKLGAFENSPILRDAVGQLLVQQGKVREGVEMLRKASLLATDDLKIREHLALALYTNKQYREAADALGRLVRHDAYSKRADLHAALGECQMQLGQFREARSSLETATHLNSSSAALWLSYAKSAMLMGDMKRAEISLKKALAIEPGSSDAHLLWGYMRLRQDRLDDALTAFKKASSLDASDTVSLCMIGYVLERSGRADQAMQYYGKALKLRPDDEMATRLMASVEVGE